jgi:hypothetical protein
MAVAVVTGVVGAGVTVLMLGVNGLPSIIFFEAIAD